MQQRNFQSEAVNTLPEVIVSKDIKPDSFFPNWWFTQLFNAYIRKHQKNEHQKNKNRNGFRIT